MTTQDNRELENVYEEIQKKMGWMGVKAGTATRMVETQSRTLPRLGPRREPAIQVWTVRSSVEAHKLFLYLWSNWRLVLATIWQYCGL